MSDDQLTVWYGSRRVGAIQCGLSRVMEFQYDSGWRSGDGFAISQSLPLVPEESRVSDSSAHDFFSNLLPEAFARERVVRQERIPDDDFELLRALGSECAGALVILPEGRTPEPVGSYEYEPLDDAGLTDLVVHRDWSLTPAPTVRRPRLALGGAQDKTAVALFDDQIWLPQGTAPSTHILKLDSRQHSNVLAYESFAMMLAEAVGLPVVKFDLRARESAWFALIERYDRVRQEDRRIERLHQEDFCQALGYDRHRKYEVDGGPSFADCCRMLREVSNDEAEDVERLVHWQIFNWLVGNSDGHAKNLSILYGEDGSVRLAPFYDLVSTRAIAKLNQDLAFRIGGAKHPSHVGRKSWETLAAECEVSTSLVLDLLLRTAESLHGKVNEVREAFESKHGPFDAMQRVTRVLDKQRRRAMRLAR